MRWLILGFLLIPVVFTLIIMVKVIDIQQPRPDYGWKRVNRFVFLTGPFGGPYVEPAGANIDPVDAEQALPLATGSGRRSSLVITGVVVLIVGGLPVLAAVVSTLVGWGPLSGALCGAAVAGLATGLSWLVRGIGAGRAELRLRRLE